MSNYSVRWIGDFGTIETVATEVSDEQHAIDHARQQLIDWHGIDPLASRFDRVEAREL